MGLLLCLFCLCGMAEEEVVIVHATDMHYLSPTLTDGGDHFMAAIASADGKVTHYTPEIMQAFVDEMLRMKPDAVVLSGDLTLNGAPQSHRELAALLAPLQDADIQVLVLPGNHDTGAAAYRFEGDGVTVVEGTLDGDFDDLYWELGYENALSRDGASMSYAARVAEDVWCLLVDTNANGTAGTVKDETLSWMEEQLKMARDEGATVIAVSHQPVLVHNELFTFGYVINNAGKVEKLYDAYEVKINLCGHLHMQHMEQKGVLTEICASSLAVSPNQFGVLKISDGQIGEYAMQALDVDAWAEKTGQADENLLRFSAYSAAFFDGTTRGQLAAALAETGASEAGQQCMMDFALRLNREYFAGRRTLTKEDAGWLLWQRHMESAFFTRYMQSILDEEMQDMTQVDFTAN